MCSGERGAARAHSDVQCVCARDSGPKQTSVNGQKWTNSRPTSDQQATVVVIIAFSL